MRDDTFTTFVNRARFDNSAQARSGSGSAPRTSARASTPVGSWHGCVATLGRLIPQMRGAGVHRRARDRDPSDRADPRGSGPARRGAC
ncbi:hypothetical protein [Streptomyces canus]|uniref:hypothetical protein n=1 Tax=Streptomyces canus TaxID=58343 RepID=UPI00384ADB30